MRLDDETTREEFERAIVGIRSSRRPVLKCECGGLDAHLPFAISSSVFRCRAQLVKGEPHFACGQWCCACVGGSDDNRCSECWLERVQWLEQRRIRLMFVMAAAQRGGVDLVLTGGDWALLRG